MSAAVSASEERPARKPERYGVLREGPRQWLVRDFETMTDLIIFNSKWMAEAYIKRLVEGGGL